MWAPSLRAFFYRRPLVPFPVGNGLLVSLDRALLWHLATPAAGLEYTPEMAWVIAHAELLADQGCNSLQGPKFVGIAIRHGTFEQKPQQSIPLPGSQFLRAPWNGLGFQTRLPSLLPFLCPARRQSQVRLGAGERPPARRVHLSKAPRRDGAASPTIPPIHGVSCPIVSHCFITYAKVNNTQRMRQHCGTARLYIGRLEKRRSRPRKLAESAHTARESFWVLAVSGTHGYPYEGLPADSDQPEEIEILNGIYRLQLFQLKKRTDLKR